MCGCVFIGVCGFGMWLVVMSCGLMLIVLVGCNWVGLLRMICWLIVCGWCCWWLVWRCVVLCVWKYWSRMYRVCGCGWRMVVVWSFCWLLLLMVLSLCCVGWWGWRLFVRIMVSVVWWFMWILNMIMRLWFGSVFW